MGISILELVLSKLREENFLADAAYPGQRYPMISEPVAAVHLEKVDRSKLTVTVEVSIICPASLGGTRCEAEALRAAEVLRQTGAACIQNGCRYDGLTQVYAVSVLATYTCAATSGDCILGPGFRVYIQEQLQPCAVSFEAEQVFDAEAVHEMGEDAPIGIHNGSWVWKFRLEELIPAGDTETISPEGTFRVRIERDTVTETYDGCRWTQVRREFTRQGLRRIRSGISTLRQEETNE